MGISVKMDFGQCGVLAVTSVHHSAYDEVRDAIEKSISFGQVVSIWEMLATTEIGAALLWKVAPISMFRQPDWHPSSAKHSHLPDRAGLVGLWSNHLHYGLRADIESPQRDGAWRQP